MGHLVGRHQSVETGYGSILDSSESFRITVTAIIILSSSLGDESAWTGWKCRTSGRTFLIHTLSLGEQKGIDGSLFSPSSQRKKRAFHLNRISVNAPTVPTPILPHPKKGIYYTCCIQVSGKIKRTQRVSVIVFKANPRYSAVEQVTQRWEFSGRSPPFITIAL